MSYDPVHRIRENCGMWRLYLADVASECPLDDLEQPVRDIHYCCRHFIRAETRDILVGLQGGVPLGVLLRRLADLKLTVEALQDAAADAVSSSKKYHGKR